MTPHILGIDFTSRPTRIKPITMAVCDFDEAAAALTLNEIVLAVDFLSMQTLLKNSAPWVGAFDFPFGLPREFMAEQGWLNHHPNDWRRVSEIALNESRDSLVARCKAYCDARPAGQKFAHRAVDRVAGSSPSMKWVNPPVLYMFYHGLPLLLALDCDFPSLSAPAQPRDNTSRGGSPRTALEGYPGFTARQITRESYKSDDRAKQTPARAVARKAILSALCAGHAPLGIRLSATPTQRKVMREDASGDSLDAVICALQATYAYQRRDARYGYPEVVDPIEGWIASV